MLVLIKCMNTPTRHLRTDDITCKPVMVVVTPLNISLNFSRVCGAKDPSLANLPSQRLEKQSKTQKEQSNRDTYEVTGILSQLVLFHSYKTKSFPEPEYNALTQAYEKEPFPQTLSLCFKAAGALLKDSSCSYKFEFPNSNVGANLVVMQLARAALNCLA